ncbi:MAG: methyltransferase domain-containing protein [Thermoleophilia bacterium]|jgi:ubiquinone/menaquinone biosynthesis C-methylase UbiE|nr:methyltransferase domain-containing protein [Thermoleophilia bacterium]
MPVFSDAYCGDLAGALGLQATDDLLEVACGAGAFLQKRATHVRHVAGIDHSEIQVRMARRRLRDRVERGTAEVVQGDSAALPWDDATFSAVACNCLGCFSRPERSLQEMLRVLRLGGRVALSIDHCPDDAAVKRAERSWGLPAWTDAGFCALLHDVGFRDIAVSHAKQMTIVRAAKL